MPLGGSEEAFYDPDAMIICIPMPGDALFTDSPSVILEVPSPNTRRIDEVQKFRDYITIPTLVTYILAETASPGLTLHRRDGAGFRREILAGPDALLDLPEAGITIPLADLYWGHSKRSPAAAPPVPSGVPLKKPHSFPGIRVIVSTIHQTHP